MSSFASEVDGSPALARLINELKSCYVPEVVIQVCESLRPHCLDTRSRLMFYTSYGTCLFQYDAPRLPAPAMFLLTHNSLIAQSKDVSTYTRWLVQNVITYDETDFKVANLIGGIYSTTQDDNDSHFFNSNWLTSSLARLTVSATHRTHFRSPAITEFTYDPPKFTDSTWNPYTFLLMLGPSQRHETSNFIRALSSFCSTELSATRCLSDVLSSSSGDIVRHQILGPTAPTWLSKKLRKLRPESAISRGKFSSFCKEAKFCVPLPTPSPSVSARANATPLQAELTLISINGIATDVEYVEPSEDDHVSSPVLLFDAYENEPSAHNFTLMSGKTIQNVNVDGIVLPLPNKDIALALNNSRNCSGSVRLDQITPEFSDSEFPIIDRSPHIQAHPVPIALVYNCVQVWLPTFPTNVIGHPHLLPFAKRIYSTAARVTSNVVTSISRHERNPLLLRQVQLWSSYRYMTNSERPSVTTVYMYSTLEHIFGTQSSLIHSPILYDLLPTR